jgi:hypothetical protein
MDLIRKRLPAARGADMSGAAATPQPSSYGGEPIKGRLFHEFWCSSMAQVSRVPWSMVALRRRPLMTPSAETPRGSASLHEAWHMRRPKHPRKSIGFVLLRVGRCALLVIVTSFLLQGHLASVARAETWPSKPIKFIVGYPPGGGADVTARLFAEPMAKGLRQRVLVENRTGAGGTIGASAVARADPDGYTLYVAAISEISIAPATVKSLPYDPLVDFKPVVLLGKWPQLLVASPSFAPNTLPELIAYAKAHPGKVSYASFGNNTLNHINGERFKLAAGIDTLHVP